MGINCKKPFSPNTTKIRPSKRRAINAAIFMISPSEHVKSFNDADGKTPGPRFGQLSLAVICSRDYHFSRSMPNRLSVRAPESEGSRQWAVGLRAVASIPIVHQSDDSQQQWQ